MTSYLITTELFVTVVFKYVVGSWHDLVVQLHCLELLSFLSVSEPEPNCIYICKASEQGFIWDSTIKPVAFCVTDVVDPLFIVAFHFDIPSRPVVQV